ncbi:hypothetical protein D6D01_02859 [Aureobasidium pullulans]|uniref:Fork-head domain-containing protein n=1 Tax=Aureobasidium pullulans TaxID=5580 RepID=A0A4S9LPQ9_AURPU|nr:hypothetical protein D6D01_02859 [Aureobasidium pullulans]
MLPAAKKRKLNRPVFAPITDNRSRLSLDDKEIPESPQEQPDTTNGTSSKPITFAQPPRFAPFTAEAETRRSVETLGSARQVQPSRFAPSDTPTGQSVVNSEQAPQILTPKAATLINQAGKLQYHDLIGMALNEATNSCLNREGIQRWVVDNVPGYDSQDVSWQRGVWVTLQTSDDFVYLSDRAKTGLWTFSDGSSNKYQKWQKPVNKASRVDSSPQAVPKIQEQVKQGANALGRNAGALAPDHELDDIRSLGTQSGKATSNKEPRAGSNTNSALPSTIDETVELIDLTMDDDEPVPPPTRFHEPERSLTGRTSTSLLQALENISKTSPKDRQLLKRSNIVAFGEPVWGSEKSVILEPNSPTPFVDGIVKNTSEEMKDNIRRGEKWEAAREKMGARMNSPLKAKIDLFRKSRTKSPMHLQQPTALVSKPLEFPSDQNTNVNPDPPQASPGSPLHGSDTGVQTETLLYYGKRSPDVDQETATADGVSAELDLETANGMVQMDVDLPEDLHGPELIEPEMLVPSSESLMPARIQIDGITQGGVRQKSLPQEPFSHEPLSEEPALQESVVEEPPRRTYADSAAQTSLPVRSTLGLEKISQIGLEPRVPAATPATVRTTANSITQTENPPEPQIAYPVLSRAPTIQLPTPQAEPIEPIEPIESQPVQENGHDAEADFENDCLSLLEEMLYPTNPTTPSWPSHLQTLSNSSSTPSVPFSVIQARPTRKQIFGKNELSRIDPNACLNKLNAIKLGAQNIGNIVRGKGYTEEERRRELEENQKEGCYDTLEELFDMPQQVVPFIHEQQLAFREYAPNALGKIGRPRVVYKIGPNAK